MLCSKAASYESSACELSVFFHVQEKDPDGHGLNVCVSVCFCFTMCLTQHLDMCVSLHVCVYACGPVSVCICNWDSCAQVPLPVMMVMPMTHDRQGMIA